MMNFQTSLLLCSILCLCIIVTSGWKIINGTKAIMHEYPQIVSVRIDGEHICGGTLLNGNTVLTAAHCVWEMRYWDQTLLKSEKVDVVLGEYDLHHMYGVEKVFQVTKIIMHYMYNREKAYLDGNDVALMKFDGYISNYEVEYIKYNTLDTLAFSKPGDHCEVVGWGSMMPAGEDTARFLQKATMQIVSNEECSKKFRNVKYVRSNICAGSGNLSTSSCRGDSGGPLFCRDSRNRHIQVGIVSYGMVPCGRLNVPTVYTKVSEVARWISIYEK